MTQTQAPGAQSVPGFGPPSESRRAKRIRVLLVGPNNVGKTWAACTFPKPVMIDVEGSSRDFEALFPGLIANAEPIVTYADAMRAIATIKASAPAAGYRTIIFDSGTKVKNRLESTVPSEQRTSDGKPTESAWYGLKEKERALVDALCDTDLNVVMTTWLKVQRSKQKGQPPTFTIDYDEKALHEFDFVFMLDRPQHDNIVATVLKSRSQLLKRGDKLQKFSYSTLVRTLKAANEHAHANGATPAQQTAAQQQRPAEQPKAAEAAKPAEQPKSDRPAQQPAERPAQDRAQGTHTIGAGAVIQGGQGYTVERLVPGFKLTPAVSGEGAVAIQQRLIRDVYRANGFPMKKGEQPSPTDEDHYTLRCCVAATTKRTGDMPAPAQWKDFTIEELQHYFMAPVFLKEWREQRPAPAPQTRGISRIQQSVIDDLVSRKVVTEHQLGIILDRFGARKVGDLSNVDAKKVIDIITNQAA